MCRLTLRHATVGARYFVLLFVAWAVCGFGGPLSSAAQRHGAGFTQEELRDLPRVCLAQNGINRLLDQPVVPEAERRAWAAELGDGYQHLHHYCYGLMSTLR